MMPAYWKSVQRIVSGDPGAAILRLRSRYEPDPAAGLADNPAEPVEAEVEVAADTSGLQPASPHDAMRGRDWTALVQPVTSPERATTAPSSLAEQRTDLRADRAAERNDAFAGPTPDRLPAEVGDLERLRHPGSPQGPYAAPLDRSYDAGEVPDLGGPDGGPHTETERSDDRQAGKGAPEISAAMPDEPERGDDPAKAHADDDRQAHWLAEWRAELDAAIDLGSPNHDGGGADNAPAQPDAPRPVVVEIEHLELAITRPAPPAAHRPARQDRVGPVVSLEAYLSNTGSGGA